MEMTDGEILALVSVPILCLSRSAGFSPGPEGQVYCRGEDPWRLQKPWAAWKYQPGFRMVLGFAGTILLRRAVSLLCTSMSLMCKEIWEEIIIQNSVFSS